MSKAWYWVGKTYGLESAEEKEDGCLIWVLGMVFVQALFGMGTVPQTLCLNLAKHTHNIVWVQGLVVSLLRYPHNAHA